MNDNSIINSILRLHEKIDKMNEGISEIKVIVVSQETRLKIVERIVYGAVSIILIGFMISLAADSITRADAKADAVTQITQMTRSVKK